MNPTTNRKDIPGLTGLRFFAAAFIVCNHFLIGFVGHDNAYFAPGLGRSGLLGMDVFFILSGFIIHYNYGHLFTTFSRASMQKFMSARFARLYPLYLLVIVLDLIISRVWNEVSVADVWRGLPFLLTATQSWFYVKAGTGMVVAQFLPRASLAWSISTEFFLYLTYPAIALLLARDRLSGRARAWLIAVSVVLLSFALAQFWRIVIVEQPQHGISEPGAVWLAFLSPYGRFGQFLIGALVSHAVVSGLIMRPTLHRILLLCSTIYVVAALLPPSQVPAALTAAYRIVGLECAIAFIIFSLATNAETFMSKLMASGPIVAGGERSYSIYIWQFFVLQFVVRFTGYDNPVIPKIAIYLVALGLFSAASYRFIEMPCRQAIRHLLMRRTSVQAA